MPRSWQPIFFVRFVHTVLLREILPCIVLYYVILNHLHKLTMFHDRNLSPLFFFQTKRCFGSFLFLDFTYVTSVDISARICEGRHSGRDLIHGRQLCVRVRPARVRLCFNPDRSGLGLKTNRVDKKTRQCL